MTEEEADAAFAAKLKEMGAEKCPNCSRQIDRGDVAWNNANTDGGTEYSIAEIQCQACDEEIARFSTWNPPGDTFSSFVECLLPEWTCKNGDEDFGDWKDHP